MSKIVLNRDSEFSKNVEVLTIYSNNHSDSNAKTVDMLGGLVEFNYYESVLEHTVKVECVVVDSGGAIKDGKGFGSIAEKLPLCGRERVDIKFRDINDNLISLTLYVNKFTPMGSDDQIMFDLRSKEYIMNTGVKVCNRLDGVISDSIKVLVSTHLESKKKVFVDKTSNSYNLVGNCRKPFYLIDFLSKYSISAEHQTLNSSAGYFFYETSEGYHYKSIDGLLSQEKKVSMLYSGTGDGDGKDLPVNYNSKILKYEKDNFLNANSKSMVGAYGSKLVLFDPFNCFYSEQLITISNTKENINNGENINYFPNPEFNGINNNTRTIYHLTDRGTLPVGDIDTQLDKSKDIRFDHKQIVVQSQMRYNQFFSHKFKIAMILNTNLHAGDAIFVDIPKLQDGGSETVDKLSGGLYIITDIRHRIFPEGAFTYCNLIRDSFGRSGKPSR